jgi:hypothetical protein
MDSLFPRSLVLYPMLVQVVLYADGTSALHTISGRDFGALLRIFEANSI